MIRPPAQPQHIRISSKRALVLYTALLSLFSRAESLVYIQIEQIAMQLDRAFVITHSLDRDAN